MSFQINIKANMATELCQILDSRTINKVPTTKINTQKVLVTNSKGVEKTVDMPYYSGNAFRGALRRECLEIVLEKMIEKKLTIDSRDFNLMNAGGGNDFQAQLPKVAAEIRELNPIISVFGASLAISSKIITPSFMPYKNIGDGILEYYTYETEDGYIVNTISATEMNTKFDDILNDKGNARFLTPAQKQEWCESILENTKARSKERADKAKEKTTKKESIQSRIAREYIIRGTNLYSSLQESQPLTQIERGMIYMALERLSLKSIGANTAKGFGKVNYSIEIEDGGAIETFVDEYLRPEIIKKDYKENTIDDMAAFDDWLDGLSEANLNIAELMK